MIEFKNVTVQYINYFASLFELNLKIEANTLFIADNFDGAYAIFRTLSKIEKDYTGDIIIDGVNIKDIKDKELSLAYIPIEPFLFNTTIDKNLIYPLKIRKINKNDAKTTVNLIKNEYNLNIFPNKIKNLSLSQKKVICLVRAIIRKPKYILLENFFDNLDKSYTELATKIISDASKHSIIIASESKVVPAYSNFITYRLEHGSIKKE